MTDVSDLDLELPTTLDCTLEFVKRLPSQRVLDALARIEPTPFGEIQEAQPTRVLAFRLLVRDHPGRDIASLWLHSYDCEVQLHDADPSAGPGPTPWPGSAPTTA
jgi:hypothetical protein